MATVEIPSRVAPAPRQHSLSWLSRVLAAIEAHPGRVMLGISGIYCVIAFTLASLRLLWFDELVTYHIARLNSLPAILDALFRGSDPNPPLSHVLVMVSTAVFGGGQVAARLPMMIAAWMGIVCLFVFLRKRVPVAYAAAGVFFFMSTRAFDYSYESRSYALTLGFAMLSLVAWRGSIEGRRPRVWAVVLAVALAAGISSNYFAVLAFFPVAAGELVRDLQRRKIEWRVWVALGIAGLSLLVYLPLINHAVAQFAPYAWNKPVPAFIEHSYDAMVDAILWPGLAVLYAVLVVYLYQRKVDLRHVTPVLPRHEMVAVMVQMGYPFIAYAIAVARAGMVSPRFVLPLCYGFAIAVAVAGYRLFGKHQIATALFLSVCLSWAIARNIFSGYDIWLERQAFYRVLNTLPKAETIVVSDSLLSLPLFYYAPREVGSKVVFPFDVEAIRTYKRDDSPEQNLWGGRNHLPIRVMPVQTLQRTTSDYIIVTTRGNWLLRKMTADREAPRELPINSDSGDLWSFFPLAHGPAFVYEVGNVVPAEPDALQRPLVP